jgi:hypothetical protein
VDVKLKKYLLPVQVARDVGKRPPFLPEQPSIFYHQVKDIFICGNGGWGGVLCENLIKGSS